MASNGIFRGFCFFVDKIIFPGSSVTICAITQMVVKTHLEPELEKHFHPDFYVKNYPLQCASVTLTEPEGCPAYFKMTAHQVNKRAFVMTKSGADMGRAIA